MNIEDILAHVKDGDIPEKYYKLALTYLRSRFFITMIFMLPFLGVLYGFHTIFAEDRVKKIAEIDEFKEKAIKRLDEETRAKKIFKHPPQDHF